MPLYPRRRNVAAQVAVELKPVTYATHPMEERRKKDKKRRIKRKELTQKRPLVTAILVYL